MLLLLLLRGCGKYVYQFLYLISFTCIISSLHLILDGPSTALATANATGGLLLVDDAAAAAATATVAATADATADATATGWL